VATLAAIWRHPVKSVGRETVAAATLVAGQALPGDRVWAIAHGRAELDPAAPAWAACRNFLRVALSHRLMQAEAAWDEAARRLTLTHPDAAPLTVDPDAADGAAALAAWAGAFADNGQTGPFAVVRAPAAMTDTDYPSVSIASLASLRALSQRMGREIDPRRFRGNLWIEGFGPWEENGWEGREIAVGDARLAVVERVVRCAATETSPLSGRRDAPTTAALRAATGAPEFGVYARVVAGGEVRVGDPVRLV
jgi:uncharacterized protein YcbX